MSVADEARDNSIQCEMVKYAYRQTKDGVVVSFVVHPNDIPAALSTSHIGARFVAVLVQIGDDELPVHQPAKEKKQNVAHIDAPATSQSVVDKPPAGAKRDWRDLQPAQQAGIRCAEPIFVAFLQEHHTKEWHETREAAACVRFILNINSRAEINTNHKVRTAWHQLDEQFQGWKALEHA